MNHRALTVLEGVVLSLLIAFLLLLAVLLAAGGIAKAGVPEGVVAPYVQIGGGSGTVIQLDGKPYVLTAFHVVEDMMWDVSVYYDVFGTKHEVKKRAEVPFKDARGCPYKGKVVFHTPVEEDGGHDLALLEVLGDPRGLHAAALDLDAEMTPGRAVWYIGTPAGVAASLERSIVSRTDYEGWTMVNGNGWYGNSGGGLFVKRHGAFYLCGVVVRMTGTDNPKAAVLAQKPSTIKEFLSQYRTFNGKENK